MIGEKKDPRKTFGQAVTELAASDERIVVLSADSGNSSGFGDFMKRYPHRYFECGIMEQGVTGVASGLATVGKIPVFCAIAPFVTCRNFEMFRNDLGYMRQNAKIVGRNGGYTYSDLGSTHHSLEDYALMRMIPGLVVLAPQDPGEIKGAVKAMLEHVGPVYMRIGNPAIPELFEETPFVIGQGRKLTEGKRATVISTGYQTGETIKAIEALRALGYDVDLLGMPTVWPLDEELILESARKTNLVITVEEHYVHGGLGGAVAELLSARMPVAVHRIGVPLEYATSGPYEDLRRYYRLDAAGLIQQIKEIIDQKTEIQRK